MSTKAEQYVEALRELRWTRKEIARIWTEVVADLEAENKRLRKELAECHEYAEGAAKWGAPLDGEDEK